MVIPGLDTQSLSLLVILKVLKVACTGSLPFWTQLGTYPVVITSLSLFTFFFFCKLFFFFFCIEAFKFTLIFLGLK